MSVLSLRYLRTGARIWPNLPRCLPDRGRQKNSFVAGKGIRKVPDLARLVEEAPPSHLPEIARGVLRSLLHMIEQVNLQLGAIAECSA